VDPGLDPATRSVKLRARLPNPNRELRPGMFARGSVVMSERAEAAESRAPIGWVIVGWLSFGTLLTLFVIPSAYTLLARRDRATGTETYEPSPAPEPAALADRFRSPQSRREWAQRR